MIIFKSIKYKNFLSSGNYFTEIPLDKNKSTLVVGQNGAGKSTMLDAISFALFGKPHRRISKSQLVNSINQKQAMVEIEFTVGKAQFKIVRGPNSTISDNQLKSGVIQAINAFFNVSNWDFGDTFYFSELATFVHNNLAPDLANMVIVPRSNGQSFGSLFQIQSKADEIFVSSATVDNIEIIDSVTASNLQASGNVVSSVEQVGTVAVTSTNTVTTTNTVSTGTASTTSTTNTTSSGGSNY